MALLVTGIYLDQPNDDAMDLVASRLKVDRKQIKDLQCVRRSLDARHRPPRFTCNYRVLLFRGENTVMSLGIPGVREYTERDQQRYGTAVTGPAKISRWPRGVRPIVVGAGPAGLFATLILARSGAEPILMERGELVEKRIGSVQRFTGGAPLDPNSNILFGEGGAGTFSDGKLYTRRRDGLVGFVLETFIRFGADPEILRESHPHLGTDGLRKLLPRLREHLVSEGAQIRFGALVRRLILENGRCRGVELADGRKFLSRPVILAIGHSARDTFRSLLEAGLHAEPKAMAVGVRVEHPQSLIDKALHGESHPDLPPAEYRLTQREKNGRAAYTFCMCPGGVVIPATAQPGHLALNGMIFRHRASGFANAALVVQVTAADYPGTDAMAGVRFQEQMERLAFAAGGGDYKAPAQRVVDFVRKRRSTSLPASTYSLGVRSIPMDDLLPQQVAKVMRVAIQAFDGRIEGFAGAEGLLLGLETRTSSPVRFSRRADGQSRGVADVYLAGEGAGRAGGIVSSAMDGIRVAGSIVERFGKAPE